MKRYHIYHTASYAGPYTTWRAHTVHTAGPRRRQIIFKEIDIPQPYNPRSHWLKTSHIFYKLGLGRKLLLQYHFVQETDNFSPCFLRYDNVHAPVKISKQLRKCFFFSSPKHPLVFIPQIYGNTEIRFVRGEPLGGGSWKKFVHAFIIRVSSIISELETV